MGIDINFFILARKSPISKFSVLKHLRKNTLTGEWNKKETCLLPYDFRSSLVYQWINDNLPERGKFKSEWISDLHLDKTDLYSIYYNSEYSSGHNYITLDKLKSIINSYESQSDLDEDDQNIIRTLNHIIMSIDILCDINGEWYSDEDIWILYCYT